MKKSWFSVSQYLAQIKDVVDRLSSIGEQVSLKDHICYILAGLGLEYNSFVTSIQHRVELPFFDDVRALLLAYEYRLDSQNSVDTLNTVQANFAGLHMQQSTPEC